MNIDSYWCDRFQGLANIEAIRDKVLVQGPTLKNLSSLPLEEASRQLRQAFQIVFYPTDQCLSVLNRLIEIAASHCSASYPDTKSFMKGIYADAPPLPGFSPPLYLTGLAGIGKTEILRAFRRILSQSEEVVVDPNHPPFRIVPPWLVTVQSRSSARDVLSVLANQDGRPYELVKRCRKLAYRDGLPFLIADELQFVTGSDSANTRVSQMLMSLGYIGVPFIFAANFSMLQRLMKRPGEEQQRLLAHPIVLRPDSPDSLDWQKTIEALQCVAPNHFLFDVISNSQDLHRYTFGRKRALSELLVLAFRMEYYKEGRVTLESISKAYRLPEYTIYRSETECLIKQAINGRPDRKRLDLWCPIPDTNTPQSGQIKQFSEAAQERDVADAEVQSALTPKEKKAASAIEKSSSKGAHGSMRKILSMPRRDQLDVTTLKQNMDIFQDGT